MRRRSWGARGVWLVLLLLLASLVGRDAQALTLRGVSDRTYTGLVIDRQQNALVLENCRNLTFRQCRFTNSAAGAVWIIRSEGITIEDTLIAGAGSKALHTDDCLMSKYSRNVRILRCDISGGGHGGVLIWRSDGEMLVAGNSFHDMGGSLLTIKEERGPLRCVIEGNRMTGAPNRDQVSRVHPTDHAVMQLSGTGNIFRNNLCWGSGRGLLLSSGGGQVCNNNLFENNVLRDFNLTAIEMQGAGGPGTLNGNIFRGNRIANAPRLLHAALPGADGNLWGNRWLNNGWFGGPLWTSAGGATTAEKMDARLPAVFQGNSTARA